VLAKYDGRTTQESGGVLRRFKVTRLPPFLILHIKRFTKNSFVEEKNPTIVNFPLRGVDVSECEPSSRSALPLGGSLTSPSPLALADVEPPPPSDSIHKYYDLVSNITHSSAAGTAREETTWKTQVHLRPPRDPKTGELSGGKTEEEDEKWFQIQDLIVEEINRGMISLGESYIQVSRRISFFPPFLPFPEPSR
jgi:U4/U6.U5 tri-snRNP-associated protein 2